MSGWPEPPDDERSQNVLALLGVLILFGILIALVLGLGAPGMTR